MNKDFTILHEVEVFETERFGIKPLSEDESLEKLEKARNSDTRDVDDYMKELKAKYDLK